MANKKRIQQNVGVSFAGNSWNRSHHAAIDSARWLRSLLKKARSPRKVPASCGPFEQSEEVDALRQFAVQ
jgi:inhibitor of KinA sporulation pathway (predicted exonuclease)